MLKCGASEYCWKLTSVTLDNLSHVVDAVSPVFPSHLLIFERILTGLQVKLDTQVVLFLC